MRKDIHNSEVPVLCRSCEARHKGMCGVLTPDELVQLSRRTMQVRHEAGTELVGDSEAITSYANVMRGVVKLTKVLEDGRQQVVGLQFAPDLLGRLYASESRVNVESASEVELCKIPRVVLESLIAKNPSLAQRLMRQALRELDEARDWMVTLGRKTAPEKVASFLFLIATHIDPDAIDNTTGSVSFELPLTRADVADFLGLTVETISRQLTKLRAEKVIEITNNRHFHVPDLDRLARRCG